MNADNSPYHNKCKKIVLVLEKLGLEAIAPSSSSLCSCCSAPTPLIFKTDLPFHLPIKPFSFLTAIHHNAVSLNPAQKSDRKKYSFYLKQINGGGTVDTVHG